MHEYKYLQYMWVWLRVRVIDYYMRKSPSSSPGLWVRVWIWVPAYNILFKQQYCIFQSLKKASLDSYEPGTKLQLPIVHVNSLCQEICLTILCNLVQWHFNLYYNLLAGMADNCNLLSVQKQYRNWAISWNVWKIVFFKSEVKFYIH